MEQVKHFQRDKVHVFVDLDVAFHVKVRCYRRRVQHKQSEISDQFCFVTVIHTWQSLIADLRFCPSLLSVSLPKVNLS